MEEIAEVPLTEFSALLSAVSSLLQDDALTLVLRNIAEREQALPPWLLALDQALLDRVLELRDRLTAYGKITDDGAVTSWPIRCVTGTPRVAAPTGSPVPRLRA